MAWTHLRDWALGSGTGAGTATNTAAAAGSTLVAVVTGRSVSSTFTVTDNLGGTWTASTAIGGDTVTPLRTRIFVRINAGDVTSVTATNSDGTVSTVVQIAEFSGGPTGTPSIVSAAAENGSSLTPPACTVSAAAGDLVVGGLATGVTNRTFTLQGSDYVLEANERKASSVNALVAWDVRASGGSTGPNWNITSGSAVATAAVTAAIAPAPDTAPSNFYHLVDGWQPVTVHHL